MEPCPECGCSHIGTDVLYSHGVAMFCQKCGHRGPRAIIEPDCEHWFPACEAEAQAMWSQAALAKKLRDVDGEQNQELRYSA